MTSNNRRQAHLRRLSSRAKRFFKHFFRARSDSGCELLESRSTSSCGEKPALLSVSPSTSSCGEQPALLSVFPSTSSGGEQPALLSVFPSTSSCGEQPALLSVSPSTSSCGEQPALENRTVAEEVADLKEEDNGYESADKIQGPQKLINSERHLISIKYALLLEQDKRSHALVFSEAREALELEANRRKRYSEEKKWTESEESDLRTLRQRKPSHIVIFNSDFFDRELEQRRRRRYCNYIDDWRIHWSLRTSNRLHGGRWKALGYAY